MLSASCKILINLYKLLYKIEKNGRRKFWTGDQMNIFYEMQAKLKKMYIHICGLTIEQMM
jgi:hypothetical protein